MKPEIFLIIPLIMAGIYIWSFFYCIKKKGFLGFLLWFLLPGIGLIIVMALPSDKDIIYVERKK